MTTNTFPPLISGSSDDLAGLKQLVGSDSSILASCAIKNNPNDSFLNPSNGLDGFGWDGFFYIAGVAQTTQATWFTEPLGLYRSARGAFPQRGIVLVTNSGLSIFDESNGSLDLWMSFQKGDALAFFNNFPTVTSNLVPKGLSYNNGLVMVTYGSSTTADINLIFDFNQDRVYADVPASLAITVSWDLPLNWQTYPMGTPVTITVTAPAGSTFSWYLNNAQSWYQYPNAGDPLPTGNVITLNRIDTGDLDLSCLVTLPDATTAFLYAAQPYISLYWWMPGTWNPVIYNMDVTVTLYGVPAGYPATYTWTLTPHEPGGWTFYGTPGKTATIYRNQSPLTYKGFDLQVVVGTEFGSSSLSGTYNDQ